MDRVLLCRFFKYFAFFPHRKIKIKGRKWWSRNCRIFAAFYTRYVNTIMYNIKMNNSKIGQNLFSKYEIDFSKFISGPSNDKEMSKSLFNMKNREPGEIPPPANPEMPVGRIKRLLKSNSLTAITNINFGWRKETAV